MRLWTLISGYDDADGLERACRSVRGVWPSADRAPIVYADGAYEKFPHKSPASGSKVFEVAERFASLVVAWPVAAPTEFLKRSSYWAGDPGDYALVLDCDETLAAPPLEEVLEKLSGSSYLIPLKSPGSDYVGAWILRLFRVGAGIHHWGAHEVVFEGVSQRKRGGAGKFSEISIVHHPRSNDLYLINKRVYYGKGIREDEGSFRQLVGA